MVCFVLAAFAIASATLITTLRINGSGRVVDNDGHRAYFTVEAVKTTHNADTSQRAVMDFTKPGESTTESTRVHLNSAEYINIVENVGQIAGPGVLRVQHGTELHYYTGRVYFIGTSNRHPGETGLPDRIVVRFFPAVTTDPTFVFEGSLTDGDVAVTTTLSY